MDRREFLKKMLLGLGVVVGFKNIPEVMAQEREPSQIPDLVAIKNAAPEKMFDEGIKALGGMKEFVKKGQTVLVKPNIGWDRSPEFAATTNPALVQRIIEHCFEAGAKKVYVFDNTCHAWQKCYKHSGIEDATQKANGTIVPADRESYYQEVELPAGKILKKTKVHEILLESNVFINVPVLKHHAGTRLTIAMKNFMGVVWDRRFYHSNDLNQCIVDSILIRKPDLNVIDADLVLMANGPWGGNKDDVSRKRSMIISSDIVAADAAATKIFGKDPNDIPYIKLAYEQKFGNMNLNELNIKRIVL